MILSAADLKESFGHQDLFGPMADENYFLIPTDYLVDRFLPFWKDLKSHIGMIYRSGRTDCDDFALVFKAEMAKAALSLNTDAAPAVGIAQVLNLETTFKIPPGNHALNFLGILDGDKPDWIMLDPITDCYATLENYHPRLLALSI